MRRLEREAIDLTQRCLQEFWQQDASFVISCLAEDVVWIGAQKDEFLVGREAAENDLREAIKQVPPCVILNGEFYALGSGSRFCTVTARYLTSTAPSAEYFLQGQQRCTFVWEKTKEGMKIRHIHVSNPMGELQLAEGEFVPTTMGKLASGYLQNEIKRLSDRRRLNVIGENGSLQSIALADIMYVMAKGKDTHLVCEDRNFLIKMSITELAEIAGEQKTPDPRTPQLSGQSGLYFFYRALHADAAEWHENSDSCKKIQRGPGSAAAFLRRCGGLKAGQN